VGEGVQAAASAASNGTSGDDQLIVRPVQRAEIAGALRVVLSSTDRLADEAQVEEFMNYAGSRGLDPGQTWIAARGTRLIWAVLPVISPGKTMLLLVPPKIPIGRDAAAPPAVAEAICHHFTTQGVHLAQVLLDPADAVGRQIYISAGFRFMAELIYLQAQVKRAVAAPVLPPGLAWLPYTPATHDLFSRTIAVTYEQSLDCPGLNGLRDVEDVVAGHKASGEFDPQFWRLLCQVTSDQTAPRAADPKPLGVLLLARMPRNDAMELVYLGLTPAARGMGLGDVLMRQALSQVHPAGRARLTLAVDAINAPATRLYYRHGMHRVGAKAALMRDLRILPAISPTDLSTASPQPADHGG
jgi:ribosomal protein S18 acetylase RimI-like enzyme